jgi:hypothetical protein
MKAVAVSLLFAWMILPGSAQTRESLTTPLSEGLEQEILGIDPDAVSDADVRQILAQAAAPKIFLIRGGIPPAASIMESLGEFLAEMGYPRNSLQDPLRQSLSYSPYLASVEMAGYVGWYYEQTGLRPMLIGHSQGGMQTVRILHELNGEFDHRLAVWDPRTGKSEGRDRIVDPLQGTSRRVEGLKVSYASALAAGGLARLNPSHLNLLGRLRTIPDTVEDFAGFHMRMDLLGGDLLGFGRMNNYRASGSATVRNIRLPWSSEHFTAPLVRRLAENLETREWINHYRPDASADVRKAAPDRSRNIIYAAELWHGVKRHWVLELQRLLSVTATNRPAAVQSP